MNRVTNKWKWKKEGSCYDDKTSIRGNRKYGKRSIDVNSWCIRSQFAEKIRTIWKRHKYTELYIVLQHELKGEIEERANKRDIWYKGKNTQIEKKEACEQKLHNAVKAQWNALDRGTKRVLDKTIKSTKKQLNKIAKEIKNCNSEIKNSWRKQYLTGRRGEKWVDHSLLNAMNAKVFADEKNTLGEDVTHETAVKEKEQGEKQLADLMGKEQGKNHLEGI